MSLNDVKWFSGEEETSRKKKFIVRVNGLNFDNNAIDLETPKVRRFPGVQDRYLAIRIQVSSSFSLENLKATKNTGIEIHRVAI